MDMFDDADHSHHTPLKSIDPESVDPPVLMVFPEVVALITNELVKVKFILDAFAVKFPYTLTHRVPANVSTPEAGFEKLMSRQLADAVTVTVYAVAFDAESKKTLSADVGTDAPHAHPDEALQFVVVEASQFAVQPTQYLSIGFC